MAGQCFQLLPVCSHTTLPSPSGPLVRPPCSQLQSTSVSSAISLSILEILWRDYFSMLRLLKLSMLCFKVLRVFGRDVQHRSFLEVRTIWFTWSLREKSLRTFSSTHLYCKPQKQKSTFVHTIFLIYVYSNTWDVWKQLKPFYSLTTVQADPWTF